MDALDKALKESGLRPQQPCKECLGVGYLAQYTSATAPTSKMKCFACGGDGKQKNCFSEKEIRYSSDLRQ